MKLFLLLYNLVFPFVLLFLLPGAVWRMIRRGNYSHKFGQRFAIYSRRTRAILRQNGGKWIWVHAVSVGEVLVALKFIHLLRRKCGLPVLLSTTTSTGFAVANSHRSSGVEVIYHPVDFFPIAKRAIELTRPVALVLVEAEIWPNLVWHARRFGARIMLLNARLSDRSLRRFRMVKPLASYLYRMPEVLCLQNKEDMGRYLELGAEERRIRVTGSVKFDLETDFTTIDNSKQKGLLVQLGWPQEAKILLGASTHAGEEFLLAKIFVKLKKDFPELRLILVPRHVERVGEILREIKEIGIRAVVSHGAQLQGAEVMIINTTGELRNWISLSSIVFIGKSLTANGGQNPAEAIALGKPVIFGPNMQNFAALTRMILENNGAKVIRDENELETSLRQLLKDPTVAEDMAERARLALEPHRGATERSLKELLALIGEKCP
ncbi:MAG: 3-deoxy-D-manno-octulosonic acid transferase [Chthoniobacterales bacterium]|nr:3-deoxy-D-manno-octulosonic acid transferase [Chthoniobacterales bacterium]